MKLFYYTLLLFSMMYFPLYSADFAGSVGASGLMLLVEGTLPVKGVPGFGPNTIPSLYGRYYADESRSVSVWAVSEPLVFSSAIWKDRSAGALRVRISVTGENTQLAAIQTEFVVQKEMMALSKWVFICEFSGSIPEDYRNAFLAEFVRRTEFFFTSARRMQDLSFPATLKVTGK